MSDKPSKSSTPSSTGSPSSGASSGPSVSMSHNGISYGLYEGRACGGCGADNWRGEKLALAHIEAVGGYLCPPCVNAYLAKQGGAS